MRINKQQWQWIFYDWANSGYGILVVTAVLPVYFKAVAQQAGVSAADSTAYWGYANSFGTLVVSLLAPLLGVLADYPNAKRRWLMYVLSIIGYSGGNLFYDSFLTDVAPNGQMDLVSSTGYGMGYLGGVIVFLGAQLTHGFNDLLSAYGIAKFSFVIAAVWWVIFGWPLLAHGRQHYSVAAMRHPLRDSFRRLNQTFRHIRHYRQITWFLVAYFFYIDGVDTTMLMMVLLVVQLIAFPFSLFYGWLARRTSNRAAILVGIIVYVIICLGALRLTTLTDFWILAILVGTSQGGLQALSRSYFGQLIPKDSSSEFFGFYNILGKLSAIMGPVIVGLMTQWTEKSTIGAASLNVLFTIGLVIFLLLPRLGGDADDQD